MDDWEFGKRMAEQLRADRDAGRLLPLAEYQRRHPGYEELVARDYAVFAGEDGATARPPLDWLPSREREHYTEMGEIARGGMGAIIRVRDKVLGRDLAMKVVLGEGGKIDPASQGARGPLARRFLEEAKITARLDHPGVVPVHELGADEDGRLYFTMKLIRGGRTLADVFRLARENDASFGRARVVQIFIRILETLAFAHTRGIIHRDLKPANVMVGDFGEVYVMDWGLAKVAGVADESLPAGTDSGSGTGAGLTEAGQVLGTPAYMPIEQARNRDLDARADLFAVGAMLYEFFAGVHPYGKRDANLSAPEILLALHRGPPVPLTDLAPDAPPELVSIVAKAMARERDDRYATAQEFARDLQSFAEGRVVLAHEAGAWAELRKWIGRNRALAGSIAAAVLLLLAGLVTAIALGVRADRERATARRLAYRAEIGAAVSDLANDDLHAARLHLGQAPEELRGWEWRHLRSRLDESILAFEASGIAFDAEGKLRSITPEGVVFERDLERGTEREIERIPTAEALWITGDGRHTVAATERPDVNNRYDIVIRRIGGGESPRTLTADVLDERWDIGSRVPRFAYMGTDSLLHVVDLDTGTSSVPRCLAETPRAGNSRSSPDGRFLLVGDLDEMLIIDLEEDRLLMRVPALRASRAISGAMSPDRTEFAVGAQDGSLEVRSVGTGAPTAFGRVRAHSGVIMFVSYSPDGRTVATGGIDRVVRLFDAATGAPIRSLQGHLKPLEQGVFSPDGRYLVTRDSNDEVRVWPIESADPCVLRGHVSYVYSLAFSPGGARLYSGGWDGFADRGGALRVWDVETGTPVAALGTDAERLCVFALAVTRDGRRVVTVGGEPERFEWGSILVWDAETGRLVRKVEGTYRTLALHPDGRHVVAMEHNPGHESDNALFVVDLEEGKVVASLLKRPVIWAAINVDPAFSPDGALLAVSGTDAREVVLHDFASLSEVRRLGVGDANLTSVRFSTDGTALLATADDDSWRVFDVATGREIGLQAGTGNEVLGGVFGPDDRLIVTGGRDRNVRLWDAGSLDEIVRLAGHGEYVKSVAAGPDGAVFASASGDGTVRLWRDRDARALHEAQVLRRRIAAEVAPRVAALFDELGDPAAVVARLKEEYTGRRREVALQVALAASVARDR